MSKLKKVLFNKGSSIALASISFILTLVPEDIFKQVKLFNNCVDKLNVMFLRILLCLIIFFSSEFWIPDMV